MYTGIIQAQLPVKRQEKKAGLRSFTIEFSHELLHGLEVGASVAVNGVCLTVTTVEGKEVSFDAIRETLEVSNLGLLAAGKPVNIERSAKQGAEIGGHLLSGHIVGTSRVIRVERSKNNRRLTFEADPDWLRFVFEKGFLGVNGASLTVAKLDRQRCHFAVNLIPETLARTNFSLLEVDDLVNIEVESQTRAIVETVERVMAERYGT